MKCFKKILALVISISIVFAIAMPTFAFELTSGYYTFELKFEDAEGKAITTAAPGSDVYVAVYVYETAAKGDIVIAKNSGSMLTYGFIVPDVLMANADDYAEADGAEYDTTAGDTTITTDGEGNKYIINQIDITAGTTIKATVPVAKHKIAVTSTKDTYALTGWYEDMISLADGTVGAAQGIVYADMPSLKVEDAAPSSPITAKNEVVGTYNGKTLKYIAHILETVDAQKKVRIKKMNGNEVVETRDSGRTLAQIVNGVASGNNTITGTIAVGVLTSNEADVFTFELYE